MLKGASIGGHDATNGGHISQTLGMVDEEGWEALVNDLGDLTDEEEVAQATDDDGQSVGSVSPSKTQDLVSLVLRKLHFCGESSSVTAVEESEPTDDRDDDLELSADGRPRRGFVAAKSALLWFTTPQSNEGQDDRTYVEQTQLGIYRSVFPDIADRNVQSLSTEGDPAQWYVAALQASQALALRKPPVRPDGPSAWKAKRIKGMDEAAAMLGMHFLEGEKYIPGLTLKRQGGTQSVQDDGEDEDESDDVLSTSSASSDEETGDIAAHSAIADAIDPPQIKMWTILLFGGGHFSLVVVALNPYIAPRAASRNRPLPIHGSDEEILGEDRGIVVLAHKAFHRYTTRRKQGGAQSLQDASGKFAKSAGAQLRRYGEAALADEIKDLLNLSGYRKLISDSERVYVRANARAARGILWSWSGGEKASPLDEPRSDGRMRTIPFSTRSKATVGECLRVFAELSRVKVSRKTETELEEEDEAYRQSLAGSAAAIEELKRRRKRERGEREAQLKKLREEAKRKRERSQALSKDEKKYRERLEKMINMVRRGRVDALVNLLEKHGQQLLSGRDGTFSIDASLPDWWRAGEIRPSSRKAGAALIPSTLLQLAAESAQEDVVQWLLVEKKADPTIAIPPPPKSRLDVNGGDDGETTSDAWPHRAAYDLLPPGSAARGARNVFRRLYAQQPDWWDWEYGARVFDSKLTEEMEGNQSRRRINMREKARQREKERGAKETSAAARIPTPETAGPSSPPPALSSATKNRLGGGRGAPRALKETYDKMQGVSQEMRMRIEREKRARAAEERMKRLQQQ